MYGYIYKRVNKFNGKTYVGQHRYISEEVKLDEKYRGSGTYLVRAIDKYGDDAFTYELIDTAENAEELNQKECYWIKKLNTIVPNGYNVCYGGNQMDMPKELRIEYARKGALARGTGWHQSQKQKDAAREYMKNRVITQSFRDKCSNAAKGNTRGSANKGKVWITDGVDNFVISPDEPYDTTIYRRGKTISAETKSKYKDAYSKKVYVTKDGKDKCINIDELPLFINDGYVVGRAPEQYVGRGNTISAAKKGCIRIVNNAGQIKYIRPEKLSEFESQGYRKYSNTRE